METDDLIVLAREKAQHYTIPPHYHGCERDHLRCLLLMLADRIEDLDSQLDTALAALKPFAHPDLCAEMGGNVEGDNSPIYARNGALLRLGDFRRAAAAIKRITHREGLMRVPVEATDPDIVLRDCQKEIDRLTRERDEARAERDALAKGISAVAALIAESRGVAGLHLNGDEAPWDDLRTGGQYEGWLLNFDVANAQIEQERSEQKEGR